MNTYKKVIRDGYYMDSSMAQSSLLGKCGCVD